AARDDDIVERERADDLAAAAQQYRLEHRPLLDLEAALRDVGESRIELADGRHREETEATEVHAEKRHASRREGARGVEHRAVAAEYAGDLDPHELALVHRVESDIDDLMTSCAHANCGVARRACGPATAGTPDAPRRSATATTASARAATSRTIPPRPTASRPASNCGLTSATTSPAGRRWASEGGRARRSEMKDTSATMRSTGSGTSTPSRAFTPSITTTRGS